MSYWDIDGTIVRWMDILGEAIVRIASFGFVLSYIKLLFIGLDLDGAIGRWLELLRKLYHANRSRSVEGFHSIGACGMLLRWSFRLLILFIVSHVDHCFWYFCLSIPCPTEEEPLDP